MRYSTEQKQNADQFSSASHLAFAKKIESKTSADERTCGILLVGGKSPRDHVLREAQRTMRWDNLVSYWSHAAIVVTWENADQARGVEVTLDPWGGPEAQVPEHNGVTVFPLSRYLDDEKYPNIAFATITLTKSEAADGAKPAASDFRSKMREAAVRPNQDRVRFPFLQLLSEWAAFACWPTGRENPLQRGNPMPSAALCDSVYQAGGFDLTPGAIAPTACPESIWGALLHWRRHLGQGRATVDLWARITDKTCTPRKTSGYDFKAVFAAGAAKRGARAKPKR